MKRLISFTRIPVKILLAISFGILLWLKLPDIGVDNSLGRWVPEESKEIIDYKRFLDEFGSDALYLISFEYTKPDADKGAEKKIMDELSSMDEINSVRRWPSRYVRLKIPAKKNTSSYIARFSVYPI